MRLSPYSFFAHLEAALWSDQTMDGPGAAEMAVTRATTLRITKIPAVLKHPYHQKFCSAVKPWSVSLTVLRAALTRRSKKSQSASRRPKRLKEGDRACSQREVRIQDSKRRLSRGIVRAIIYLFFD